MFLIFPQTGLPMGFYLAERLDTRAGQGWVWIWVSVYGLHCTCLLHVFMMSLC